MSTSVRPVMGVQHDAARPLRTQPQPGTEQGIGDQRSLRHPAVVESAARGRRDGAMPGSVIEQREQRTGAQRPGHRHETDTTRAPDFGLELLAGYRIHLLADHHVRPGFAADLPGAAQDPGRRVRGLDHAADQRFPAIAKQQGQGGAGGEEPHDNLGAAVTWR